MLSEQESLEKSGEPNTIINLNTVPSRIPGTNVQKMVKNVQNGDQIDISFSGTEY